MTKADVDAAQAQADAAWAIHDQALTDLRAALHDAFDQRKAATGITMGPQIDAAVDIAITTAIDHAPALSIAANEKALALRHQNTRDEAAAGLAPAVAALAAPPTLEQGDPAAVRAWLQHADAKEVRDALNEITDGEHRALWAETLLGWCRQDGNTADVINILRAADPTTETVPVDPNQKLADDPPTPPIPGTFKKPTEE